MAGRKPIDGDDASSAKNRSDSKFSTKRSKNTSLDESPSDDSSSEDSSLSDAESSTQSDSEDLSTKQSEDESGEVESEAESTGSEESESKQGDSDSTDSSAKGTSSSYSVSTFSQDSSDESSSKEEDAKHSETTSTASSSDDSSSENSFSESSNSDFSDTENKTTYESSSESSVSETSDVQDSSKSSETYSPYSYTKNEYDDEPLVNRRTIAIGVGILLIILAIILFFLYSPHQNHVSTTTIPIIASVPPLITVSSIKVNGLVVNLVGVAVAKTQGSSIDYNKSIIDWNDGNVTSFSDVQHTYSSYKNYTIKLTVYDTLKNKNSTIIYVRLTPQYPPSLVVFSHINGTTVKLNGTALPNPAVQSQGAIISQVKIAWGDGAVTDGRTQYIHAYKSAGTYQVAVTAIDSLGNQNTIFRNVSVYPLTFGSSNTYPSSVCPVPPSVVLNNPKIQGLQVSLSGIRSNSVMGGTINWGDGNVTSIDQYSHFYSAGGIYTATVIVYDRCNNKNSYPVYVQTQ